MPYFATFDLFRLIEGEYSLVEYTITKDGTLLLALTDLALATDTDEQALLSRVQRAVDAQVERVLSASSGIESWIRADREVWELQRWQPFVGWGSSFPGHLYPGERRWVRRDHAKRTQSGFSTEGWRLDPTVVTADGWSYALVPQRLRARQEVTRAHKWVRWRRWVPDAPALHAIFITTPHGDKLFCEAHAFAAAAEMCAAARRDAGRLNASFRRKASHGSPCAGHPASDADTAGGGETTTTTVAAHSPPGTRFPPSGLKPTRVGGDTGGGPAAATARTGAACGEPLPPHPLARAPAAAAPRAPGARVVVPGDVSGDASGELSRDVSGDASRDVSREPWASRGSDAVGEEAAADAALVERILARPSTYEEWCDRLGLPADLPHHLTALAAHHPTRFAGGHPRSAIPRRPAAARLHAWLLLARRLSSSHPPSWRAAWGELRAHFVSWRTAPAAAVRAAAADLVHATAALASAVTTLPRSLRASRQHRTTSRPPARAPRLLALSLFLATVGLLIAGDQAGSAGSLPQPPAAPTPPPAWRRLLPLARRRQPAALSAAPPPRRQIPPGGPRGAARAAAAGARAAVASVLWALCSLSCSLTPRLLSRLVLPLCTLAGLFWAWLRLPTLLGVLFSAAVTRFGTKGHPVWVETLHLRPSIAYDPPSPGATSATPSAAAAAAAALAPAAPGAPSAESGECACGGGWRLHLVVTATGFGFGNPPGFPHRAFVQADSVTLRASAPLPALWRWLADVRCPLPLKQTPGYRGYGVFRFDAVDIDGVGLHFEMSKGEFNVNGFVRLLATCEVQHKLGKDTPLPNLLSVHVGTAVGLRTGRANLLTGERSCHPRVVLCVRGAKRHTARTVQRTARRAGRGDKAGEPALAQEEYSGRQGEGGGAGEGGDAYAPPEYYWGEELSLPLSDASAVLHVCVYDGTAASTLLGQWMTTLKWLVLDPSNCEHSALHVERVGEVAGWFVLSDEKWGGLGGCGEIYLRLSWTHSPGLAPPSPPRLTALEQLSLNSAETTLRLGNPAGVQAVLTHAPFLLDVRRITIRDVEFFVKDLFMGRRGQVEAGSKHPDSVRIALLEFNRKFGPRDAADAGITVWDFLVRFFLNNAMPQVLDLRRPGPLTAFMRQSMGGIHSSHMQFWFSVHNSHVKFWQGVGEHFRRPSSATPAAPLSVGLRPPSILAAPPGSSLPLTTTPPATPPLLASALTSELSHPAASSPPDATGLPTAAAPPFTLPASLAARPPPTPSPASPHSSPSPQRRPTSTSPSTRVASARTARQPHDAIPHRHRPNPRGALTVPLARYRRGGSEDGSRLRATGAHWPAPRGRSFPCAEGADRSPHDTRACDIAGGGMPGGGQRAGLLLLRTGRAPPSWIQRQSDALEARGLHRAAAELFACWLLGRLAATGDAAARRELGAPAHWRQMSHEAKVAVATLALQRAALTHLYGGQSC